MTFKRAKNLLRARKTPEEDVDMRVQRYIILNTCQILHLLSFTSLACINVSMFIVCERKLTKENNKCVYTYTCGCTFREEFKGRRKI